MSATKKLLTAELATELLKRRLRTNHSQYSLANKLGWPRSKVKRLEKAEVKTVSVEDYRRWNAATAFRKAGVQEPATKRGTSKKATSSATPKPRSKKVGVKKPRSSSSRVEKSVLFRVVGEHPRSGSWKNQRFFEVEMKTQIAPVELLGRRVPIRGLDGTIHGVENTRTQDPLKAGDRVVIMLWGPGIASKKLVKGA